MRKIVKNSGTFIDECDLTKIENEAIVNGQLQAMPSAFYDQFSQEELSYFCHNYAFYCLPTTELIDWLKPQINVDETIEVGSGNGCLGRSLGIKMTDSYQHDEEAVQAYYDTFKIPTNMYGSDVEQLDGLEAVKIYKPKTVIASWVTDRWKPGKNHGNMHGIKEDILLNRVMKYIHIGNSNTHGAKKILLRPHTKYQFPWLYSRSLSYENNIIYVWDKTKKKKWKRKGRK